MTTYRPYAVHLRRRRTLSPSFVRITLAGDDLGSCGDVLLDQRVKLLFGDAADVHALASSPDWYATYGALSATGAVAMRTYTLVEVRSNPDGSGEVDIDIVPHDSHPEDGPPPGSSFATAAPLGTAAVLVAPQRGTPGWDSIGVAWRPDAARQVTLAGDETALPAIANILEHLHRTQPRALGTAIIAVPHQDDVRALRAPDGVEVQWRVRAAGERATGIFSAPTPAESDDGTLLWDEPEQGEPREQYGWIAGEAGWVREIRAEARAAGRPKGEVAFMGYWKRGTTGL